MLLALLIIWGIGFGIALGCGLLLFMIVSAFGGDVSGKAFLLWFVCSVFWPIWWIAALAMG
jgi:hypothetical protein